MTSTTIDQERIRAARRVKAAEYRKKNREQINAYQKQWRDNNPEAVKRHQEEYWLRKADELKVN